MSHLTGRCLRILIVDDEPIVRLVHSKLLSQAGHHITQAENGEQAVALAKNHPFDVILMDINMPVMNGLDSTAKIRAQESEHRAYIIGISGLAPVVQEDCLAKGMDKVLEKPATIAQLHSVLEQIPIAT